MLSLVLWLLVQTTPGNITKVPRGADICSETDGLTSIFANQPYDLVIFTDSGLRYRFITVTVVKFHGLEFIWSVPASDTAPLCASGPNVGKRPHLVPLEIRERGTYMVYAVAVNDPAKDGIDINHLRVLVQ